MGWVDGITGEDMGDEGKCCLDGDRPFLRPARFDPPTISPNRISISSSHPSPLSSDGLTLATLLKPTAAFPLPFLLVWSDCFCFAGDGFFPSSIPSFSTLTW